MSLAGRRRRRHPKRPGAARDRRHSVRIRRTSSRRLAGRLAGPTGPRDVPAEAGWAGTGVLVGSVMSSPLSFWHFRLRWHVAELPAVQAMPPAAVCRDADLQPYAIDPGEREFLRNRNHRSSNQCGRSLPTKTTKRSRARSRPSTTESPRKATLRSKRSVARRARGRSRAECAGVLRIGCVPCSLVRARRF